MSKQLMYLLPSLLLLAVASNAAAQQVISVGEIAQVKADISLNEPNLLVVEGRKLMGLKGWNDELQIQLDEVNGSATFFVAAPKPGMKIITMQGSDDAGGTYVFNLTPKDVPGELIILKPQSAGKHGKNSVAKANDYQRAVKNMLLTVAGNDADAEFVVVNKEVPLWNEARFYLQRKYLDADLVGEKYFLTNVSTSEMVLAEQEFYRAGVMLVAVESHNLAPGASTPVYIVRARKENE